MFVLSVYVVTPLKPILIVGAGPAGAEDGPEGAGAEAGEAVEPPELEHDVIIARVNPNAATLPIKLIFLFILFLLVI
ncbi:hypothetical protein D3C85_1902110 [compost metagenome]